ncbi:MAG TPA: hypothetical protein VGA85_01250 [Dehalococcoidales bacterium]
MGNKVISQRHKPSWISYLRENFNTTFAITEKAELMAALGLIFLSAMLGLIGGLSAPIINEILNPWQLRVSIGLVVFIVVQFGIITPFRMWRKAVWVVNVEKCLNELWDLHEEGVVLLNSHAQYQRDMPNWKNDTVATTKWVREW